MEETKPSLKPPRYFLINDVHGYAIGTTEGFSSSERTLDIPFNDFAQDYRLQEALCLMSTVLMKPAVHPLIASPLEGRDLEQGVAGYLSAFKSNAQEGAAAKRYLLDNGTLRIHFRDEELRDVIVEGRKAENYLALCIAMSEILLGYSKPGIYVSEKQLK